MSRGPGDAVDSLQRYMRDVRRLARLDPEEEKRLALLLEDGRRATAELATPDVSPDPQPSLQASK